MTNIAHTFQNAWAVFLLFTIPIGGGIPAGVLLGQAKGVPWPVMMVLYFFSDIVLAFVFEPIMLLIIAASKRNHVVDRFRKLMRESVRRSTEHFGTRLGPLGLILISFGVDPMTGRAATRAAGHGFITGWALAITGDMFFFALIMASTLWLNSILGDGTWTMIIILAVMIMLPPLIRRVRQFMAQHRSP